MKLIKIHEKKYVIKILEELVNIKKIKNEN